MEVPWKSTGHYGLSWDSPWLSRSPCWLPLWLAWCCPLTVGSGASSQSCWLWPRPFSGLCSFASRCWGWRSYIGSGPFTGGLGLDWGRSGREATVNAQLHSLSGHHALPAAGIFLWPRDSGERQEKWRGHRHTAPQVWGAGFCCSQTTVPSSEVPLWRLCVPSRCSGPGLPWAEPENQDEGHHVEKAKGRDGRDGASGDSPWGQEVRSSEPEATDPQYEQVAYQGSLTHVPPEYLSASSWNGRCYFLFLN